MSLAHAISTDDNPFDPFNDFNRWYNFDVEHGYHSCALLARVSATSNELPQSDQDRAVEAAIDTIVQLNLSGHHIKVSRSIEE